MADYIEDTGNSGKDALLGGTYTTDAPNKTLTLGADGTADSGFIFPDDGTHWMLVETYDIEGVAGALGGHWWTVDVPSGLQAFIQEKQAIADAEYTTYKIVATHYNGSDAADVYIGSETVPFPTTADQVNEPFTPPVGNWIITDTILAPVADPLGEEIYNGVMIGSGGNAVDTDLGNGDWNISQGSGDDINNVGFYFTVRTENPVLITFNATLTTPTIIFRQHRRDIGTIDIDYVVVEGANELTLEGTQTGFDYYYLYSNAYDTSSEPFDVDFRDVSIREIL